MVRNSKNIENMMKSVLLVYCEQICAEQQYLEEEEERYSPRADFYHDDNKMMGSSIVRILRGECAVIMIR
jgi:hypothetical protein